MTCSENDMYWSHESENDIIQNEWFFDEIHRSLYSDFELKLLIFDENRRPGCGNFEPKFSGLGDQFGSLFTIFSNFFFFRRKKAKKWMMNYPKRIKRKFKNILKKIQKTFFKIMECLFPVRRKFIDSKTCF